MVLAVSRHIDRGLSLDESPNDRHGLRSPMEQTLILRGLSEMSGEAPIHRRKRIALWIRDESHRFNMKACDVDVRGIKH